MGMKCAVENVQKKGLSLAKNDGNGHIKSEKKETEEAGS